MNTILKGRYSWLVAPALFLLTTVVLLAVWGTHTREWINFHFDADGISPVESATIGVWCVLIGLLCLLPAMKDPRKWRIWRADFILACLIAMCRELDWHKAWVTTKGISGLHGTAYKLKFLTSPNAPMGDKLIVILVFAVFFVVLGGTLAYFLPRLWKGLFKLHPVSWSIGFLGGTGLLVGFFDIAPRVFRKDLHIELSDSMLALLTTFEEGLEILLPVFGILALLQAHEMMNGE